LEGPQERGGTVSDMIGPEIAGIDRFAIGSCDIRKEEDLKKETDCIDAPKSNAAIVLGNETHEARVTVALVW
jgi:hypothetical protein